MGRQRNLLTSTLDTVDAWSNAGWWHWARPTELVSGTASDVVVVFPGNGNLITAQTLARGDYLVDLADQPWAADFNDAHKTVMGADGEILMVANNFTIIPATYNAQALEALGASAPSTWSEVLDLCSAAKAEGKVAYAMGGLAGGTFNYLPYALSATLVDGKNPDFAAQQAAGDTSFAESDWATAFDKYVEMLDAGCFTQDALGTSLEIAQEQVAKGDAVGPSATSSATSSGWPPRDPRSRPRRFRPRTTLPRRSFP